MEGGTEKKYGSGEWVTAALIVVIGIPIALLFVSCGGSESGSAPTQADLAQKEFLWIETAKDSVRSKLKDPASATFRNEAVKRQSGAPLVCGEVNANNSFGGKSGHQRFIFMGSQLGSVLEEDMAASEFEQLWSQTCTR